MKPDSFEYSSVRIVLAPRMQTLRHAVRIFPRGDFATFPQKKSKKVQKKKKFKKKKLHFLPVVATPELIPQRNEEKYIHIAIFLLFVAKQQLCNTTLFCAIRC